MRYRFPLSFFMKITGIAWMSLLCLGSPAQAQEEGVDTLFWNGPAGERINVVVLPDGYVASEREVFVEDARRIVRALMETTPFLEYDTFFNGVAVFVPSEETGANHPGTATDVSEPVFPVAVVNNRFGSRFDVGNIHRLLVPSKGGAILTALAEHFPQYDQVIILVNTPYYGGSGGAFATTSLHPSAPQIAIHEIGHSFAQLADEYYAGDQYARETHNMTANTDPATVRWKNWYGDEGIGIYQHCCGGRSAEFYRPHENCMMRSLGRPFCAVCRERIVARIYELVNPLTLTPEPGREFLLYENDTLDFSAAYLANGQGDNLMRWWLDAVHLGDSPVDRATSSARAAFLRARLIQGVPVERLRAQDDGRALIRPLLDMQHAFRNVDAPDEPFGYGAIDGRPVPQRYLEKWEVPDAREIILASDGYPALFPSLVQTEEHLRAELERDPLRIGRSASTKGVAPGAVSFDDRAYLRLAVTACAGHPA